jgi:Domain of unknown function (DUF1707)
MDSRLRASDAEREETVAALRRHVADGRISVEEFSDRSAAAYGARTLGELTTITADLPPVYPELPSETDRSPRWARPAWLAAGLAAATVVGFGLLSALAHAAAAAPMMGGMCH